MSDVGDVRCWGCGVWGCGMFGMWDVRDVRCWGCGMLEMWDNRDVGCRVWNVCRDVTC